MKGGTKSQKNKGRQALNDSSYELAVAIGSVIVVTIALAITIRSI